MIAGRGALTLTEEPPATGVAVADHFVTARPWSLGVVGKTLMVRSPRYVDWITGWSGTADGRASKLLSGALPNTLVAAMRTVYRLSGTSPVSVTDVAGDCTCVDPAEP